MATISAAALISRGGKATDPAATAPAGKDPKIWATAQDFEAMVINALFEPMLSGLGKEGPFGGGSGVETWRGMMVGEWSKSIAASGGLGLANQIYSDIVALQEIRS